MFAPLGKILLLTIATALLAALTATAPVRAQTAEDPALRKLETAIRTLDAKADELAGRVAANADDDSRLVRIRIEMEQVATQALESSARYRPRLEEINERLEQLGQAPDKDAAPEPELVTEERNALLAERAEINVLLGRSEDISLRMRRLISEVGVMRRDLFTSALSRRYQIGEALNGDVLDAFVAEAAELRDQLVDGVNYTLLFKLKAVIATAVIALAAAFVLLFGGRRVFRVLIERDPRFETPSYLGRLSVAFWSTLLPTLALGVFLAASLALMDYFGILGGDLEKVFIAAAAMIVTVFFVSRLANAVLSPAMPNWQLVRVRPTAARILVGLISATGLVTAFDFLLTTISDVFGSPLSVSIAKNFFAAIIVGLLLLLMGLVRPFTGEDGRARSWPRYMRYLLLALGLLPIVAALLGYIGFARFVSQQIVLTGAIVVTMYIGFLTGRAITEEDAFQQSHVGELLRERFGLSAARMDQLSVAISIIVHVLVLVIGSPLILLLWGFRWSDIQAWVVRVVTRIEIGSISFSLVGIVSGLLLFVAGYFVIRRFQRWFDSNIMARGRVESGLRNSISTAVGYAGLGLVALFAITAAGISLSSLALVAGALSLGIGFGLQNVVSNFVSGLILLAERPFKAGDWIVAGTVSGTVKKISVRATEIETFQRQTIILPNSELINSAVGNWTHRNKLARVEIPIGVSYGSDPEQVRAILLEIAGNHPKVLKNPGPYVLFTGFGDSSLDFELRIYIGDVDYLLTIPSEIRFQIVQAFREQGVEIPFPQRDVHLKLPAGAPKEAAALKKAIEKSAAPPDPPRRRGRPDPD